MVVNLESVTIVKDSPYTLKFKGYVPTYGHKLYTFVYDGDIGYTDFAMSDDKKTKFADLLAQDYGFGREFDFELIQNQLKEKSQYRL